ncbi:MAG: hypothetical protein ACTSYD_13420 [Candidatus Heimdallarchaeaceae archaeon]
MAVSPAFLINVLSTLLNTDSYNYLGFGLEFGSSSEERFQHPLLNGIVVSPFVNLKLAVFMKKQRLNAAVTILPLSLLSTNPPFSAENYELLRSFVTNDYMTFVLSKQWLYSPIGAMDYFMQTLSISNLRSNILDLSDKDQIVIWDTEDLTPNDFLSSLSLLTRKWFAYPSSSKSLTPFVLWPKSLSSDDITKLRNEGVKTIFSFVYDSAIVRYFKHSQITYIFLDFWEFCNIALRKFAQILQLEVDIPVYHFSQDFPIWLSAKDFSTEK